MIGASMKTTAAALVLALGMTAVFGGVAVISRQASPPADLGFEDAFENAAELIRPSVVSITSTRWADAGRQGSAPVPRGFEQFFGRRGSGKSMGLGSGVIVDDSGYIVTNNHVIDGADKVSVRLWDDRVLEAEVVGTDRKTDLAVVQISPTDLQPAIFGSSEELRVGQWVLAVGSPFGLDQTVTTGIISAKGRKSIGLAEYEDFIQTDASINRGNSGGPLIDLRGRVIGINTAIASQGGGHEGIGFAIPIDMVRHITDSLIGEGQVTRGWMGIAIQNLTPELAASFDYDGGDGVLISDVLEAGPAADTTLASGDIITAINGDPVSDMAELRHRVARMGPESRIEVSVVRRGETMVVEMRLGEMPGNPRVSRPRSGYASDMGLQLAEITGAVRRRLDLGDDATGAAVIRVRPHSTAAKAGVRAGDVIVAVQGLEVGTVPEFRNAVRGLDREVPVRLLIVRGESSRRFVVVNPAR